LFLQTRSFIISNHDQVAETNESVKSKTGGSLMTAARCEPRFCIVRQNENLDLAFVCVKSR